MIINHNMNAQNAHRNMGMNTVNAGKSMEKLSSGLRINRAGDDAAGLAISEKMRGQIRGLDQAARNSQDGISLIQTAEGALNETHSILQRMRELAVQATNGTLTDDDRSKIQGEANQLAQEIDKIGNQTEFNTKKLLNGEIGTVATSNNTFLDTNAKTAVGVLGTSADTKSGTYAVAVTTAGVKAHSTEAAWSGGIVNGDQLVVTTNGKTTTYGLNVSDDQQAIVEKINSTSDESGVEAYINKLGGVTVRATAAGTDHALTIAGSGAAKIGVSTGTPAEQLGVDAVVTVTGASSFTRKGNDITVNDGDAAGLQVRLQGVEEAAKLAGLAMNTASADGDTLTINGKTIALTAAGGTAITSTNDLRDRINSISRLTGVIATNEGGGLTLTTMQKGDGAAIAISWTGTLELGDTAGNSAGTGGNTAALHALASADYAEGTDNISNGDAANGVNIVVTANDVAFHVGANSDQTMSLKVGDMRASKLGTNTTVAADFASVSELASKNAFSTAVNSEKALKVLDRAISQVSTERGNLGAVQNRLEHTIANLGTSSENLTSAESRIRDVDMAKEMMNFSKNNILSQAAQAMLVQANQQPQGVLQLLR
jgi:flagellin